MSLQLHLVYFLACCPTHTTGSGSCHFCLTRDRNVGSAAGRPCGVLLGKEEVYKTHWEHFSGLEAVVRPTGVSHGSARARHPALTKLRSRWI